MPYIKQETIDELLSFPLAEAIGKIYTDSSYKVSRGIGKGLSPFQNERTPSFSVSSVKSIWRDFASATSGKSVIDFVMKFKKLDYVDAVKYACEQLNITVEYVKETDLQREKREKKQTLTQILEKTSLFYQKKLRNLSPENEAKKYLLSRDFSDEILEDFEIGYAAPGLYELFKEQAIVSEGETLGLLKKNSLSNGGRGYYDFFKYRIIFPICNKRGECVGFGGRMIPKPESSLSIGEGGGKGTIKYLNSPESDIFNKSELLYGFHLAQKIIYDKQEVYLVEGYTDVMRMHQIGLKNTVATLGTALTELHLQGLKKSGCKKIIIFRDSDTAGIKAAWRDLDMILTHGFLAEIVTFNTPSPEGERLEKEDPDSIGKKENADELITSARKDAVTHKIKLKYDEAVANAIATYGEQKKITLLPEDKKQLTEMATDLLSKISDEVIRESYQETLKMLFGLKINIKPQKEAPKETVKKEKTFFGDITDSYIFPDDIEDPNQFAEDIKLYGIFQTNNQIYALVGKDGEIFKSISNFSIEIVQHMQDEKFPMKLIRICNVFGREIIFDTLSQNINSVQGFFNLVTGFGNFIYNGTSTIHQKLLTYLFNKMGHGRKIEVLGWQPEGFWVWNNKVIVPKQYEEEINQEGLFKFKNECYYIPSANKMYENNTGKYINQKKFQSFLTEISLEKYLFQMVKVHRKHAYSGILFAVSSLFQDVVVNHLGFFPLLFLYGKGSSGKDNLGEAIQSFVGKPQSAINLESGLSTGKASIREFAQFSNGISQLSEYKRGDKQTDGTLKSLWDRRGYKMGTIESKVSTDEVPILSSVIITGNEFPESQPLLMRVIFEEMNKNEFTNEEIREFDRLKSIVKQGISELTNRLLQFRNNVENDFNEAYKQIKSLLNQSEEFKGTAGRIVENLSVLTTFYRLFTNYGVNFPFSFVELLEHWKEVVTNINNKLSSASPISKFWECFLFCMRSKGTQEAITVDHNYKEEGGNLYFNFTTIFGIVQRQWYSQYHEAAPSKTEMRRMLKDDASFVNDKGSMRINSQINSPTSVLKIDANKLSLREELLNEVEFQRMKANPNSFVVADNDEILY